LKQQFYSLIKGKKLAEALEFGVAASCLKYTIPAILIYLTKKK
jgi:sugar/nucleoside kinase (ribokinase family)